jgi:oligopeptide/dipeptide ABC transporter ATP-binding protein
MSSADSNGLTSSMPTANGAGPLVDVRDLSVTYSVRGRGGKRTVSAVDGVSFHVDRAETLGLVGESGCGKTTTGRTLLGRIPVAGGSISFDGRDITRLSRRGWRDLHSDIQLIFQSPYASMNPRMTVSEIIGEPLFLHGLKGEALRRRTDELLDLVRLPRSAGRRYPHAFSGGQRQRVVIARALALNPRFVVADEPVSALDVSIQAQVIALMMDLQRELGISYLFIAHNLAVVRHITHRVAVMYLGHLVEVGEKESLYAQPTHPYTRSLLSAAPIPDPTVQREQRIILKGDPPSPINPPTGCRFHTRCELAIDRCRTERPSLVEVAPNHQVACWVMAPPTPVSVGIRQGVAS